MTFLTKNLPSENLYYNIKTSQKKKKKSSV